MTGKQNEKGQKKANEPVEEVIILDEEEEEAEKKRLAIIISADAPKESTNI